MTVSPTGSRSRPGPSRAASRGGLWLGTALLGMALAVAWVMLWQRPGFHTLRGPGDPPPAWPDMRLNLNEATAAELTVLPGIGPSMAERIVADREANGPFANVADLDRVPGIGSRLIERLNAMVVVEPPPGDG